ncbi:MAG: hypothetical protein WCP22_03290 [Chlamydiota bacterium]
MSIKIPKDVREPISARVYELADAHNYLAKGRIENGVFMEQLVAHHEIGDILARYIAKDKIKTYIKDALLNRYAKERRAYPETIDEHLALVFGPIAGTISYIERDRVSIHRAASGHVVFAARVGYLKWETGLRKLLIAVARAKGLSSKDVAGCHYALLVFQGKGHVNTADRQLVIKALKIAGVECIWC